MTSRTREWAESPATDPEPTDPALADLVELYARHAPDLQRGDHLPLLRGAARGHLQLARARATGEPLIRVRDPQEGADAGVVVEIVTDDMPFLVESLSAAVARAGVETERVIHPIVVVRRDSTGELQRVLTDADPAAPPADALVESWIHFDLLPTDVDKAELEQTLGRVLRDVREIVEDAVPMVQRARQVADDLPRRSATADGSNPADVAQLLRWLADDHFTFLGYRHYTVKGDDLVGEPESGLGVLRKGSTIAEKFAPRVDKAEGQDDLLVMTRASAPSPLRPVHPYYLAIRTFNGGGRLIGEHRFLGLLTVPALYESVLDIPVVERRVRDAIHRAGFPLESYSGQRMLEVISGLPREELFAVGEQRLHDTAVGVLAVAGRRAVRAFLRPDPYRRFISCLVYVPRDRYSTDSRIRMAEVLQRRLGGRQVEFTVRLSESSLAMVHFTVLTDPDAAGFGGVDGGVDVAELQDELTEAVRTWDDRLLSQPDTAGVAALLPGVPEPYKAAVAPQHAVEDLRRIVALSGAGAFDTRMYVADVESGEPRFTLYLAGAPVSLTAVLPVLQRLGVDVLDERPSEFVRADGLRCWVYDFGLQVDDATHAAFEDPEVVQAFCAAFRAAWRGDAESDRFSALVLRAGLVWRDAAVLRAYARYARQLGSPYGPQYMADTLLAYPAVARALMVLFRARFAPDLAEREREMLAALAEVRGLIDAVTGLDADRILRGYLAMITATLRTNYFRDRAFLSFKLNPAEVPGMPAPRPRFEIFVYSPRVEGVHLRFGPVARGGLRYSDRPQDYRTEILGLVKAQAVKNAVIVPVGAKGGFVVRRADAGPDEVEFCYRMFISGLLDVTDNLVGAENVPPPNVVRHDGDDSYLVVAADKGTAKFSDVANDVAAQYGFWLGDAFASGGSVGYDHKAMGITAKGAWESVKRHFRELGVDTQTEEFTVVGVGDMSGDVFGNGMLLSRHIRLLAAFDHRHVFVDPSPDAAASFAERERLFALPRSSWDDYDRSVISAGGGVWPRTAKSVPIGPEIRAALGIDGDAADQPDRLSPPELIAAILRAPADLLWNGGIGTYVKASDETHADAGDKANDPVRADASELRVKVVGEGGNLGLTQRGRIEFARRGGKINTDAIDNSAGVDCSDHEVNIKILLDRLVAAGELLQDARNALLLGMTDEVGRLVLADNSDQNDVLGIARAHAAAMVSVHARLTADLETRRGLDRELEVLPDDASYEALEAAGAGLSSPELATLLAHTKLDLTAQVLTTELPDVAAFATRLPEYFPHAVRERFAAAVREHPLRREIVTTMLVNEMVDGAGMTYAFRLGEELSAAPTDAVRAYAVTTAVYDLPALWEELRSPRIPTSVSDGLVLETRRLLDRASRWFLTNRPQPLAVGAEVSRFAATMRDLRAALPEFLRGRELATVEMKAAELRSAGLDAEAAMRNSVLIYGYGLLDVVELTELSERDREAREPHEVAALYYGLSEHLGVDSALTSVTALERGDRWHALARLALRDDLYASLRAITLDALREAGPGTSVDKAIALWEKANASRLLRARAALQEVGKAGQLDLATLSVVSRQLRGLAR